MAEQYERRLIGRYVASYILKALQSLGGSASKKAIKEEIVADDSNPITYENAFEPITARSGREYYPFDMDISFALVNLHICGYIEDYGRHGDIKLTEMGRIVNYAEFPSDEEKEKIRKGWEKRSQERAKRKNNRQEATIDDITNNPDNSDVHDDSNEIIISDDENSSDNWKITVLEQIKQFSPKKFESFSRLLMNKMGVQLDREKGTVMSADHGIDGYGYFESDEFRTARVVIQCKRFTKNNVSEPDIDKFKGVMSSFDADYGIFITTSSFTKQAQLKARKGKSIITLIDGQHLVDLIEKYQLFITPVQTYILEDYYFQKD